MYPMKVRQLFEAEVKRLIAENHSQDEAKNLVLWLLEHHYGYSRTDLAREKAFLGDPGILINAVNELIMGRPIQHITGKAHFYGRDFIVDANVLIPRRETEELVYWILSDHKDIPFKAIDIGTGSGCIPITLKAERPNASVYGADISKDALQMAKVNAVHHEVDVNYLHTDVFHWEQNLPSDFTVLVSNPPYVCESEKKEMKKQVLDHEPALALFVKDTDPLIFYKAIGKLGMNLLLGSGLLYVEINERFGKETCELFEAVGYDEIELRKDMQGKERMIRARKP